MKSDERRIWRQQAEALGWSHSSVMERAAHEPLTDAERFDRAYAFVVKHLAQEFHTAAVISHEKLGMYAARGLIGTGIVGGQNDIKRVVELVEQRGIRFRGENVALVVGMFDGQVRVATTAQVRIEDKLAAMAQSIGRDKSGALSFEMLRQAIDASDASRPPDQRFTENKGRPSTRSGRRCVDHADRRRRGGKTTLLQPLVAAWQSDTRFNNRGREVIGAAMAWRQADALKDAGIRRTYSLSPLLQMIEAGRVSSQPEHRAGARRGQPDRPPADAQAAGTPGPHWHDDQDAGRPGTSASD